MSHYKPLRTISILLLFVLLISLSSIFDYKFVERISEFRNSLLDTFMLWITFFGSTFFILFFSTSLFMWREHKRRWILPLWVSLLIASAAVSILKYFIPRARPYELGIATLTLLKYGVSSNSSFPSFHSAAAFSALPVLDKEFPYFKFIWLAFACLVAFSRVYFGLHYLSDVIVGAFLGYLSGILALRLEERYKYTNIIRYKRKKRK